VADWLDRLRAGDPARFESLRRRERALRRALDALRLPARLLVPPPRAALGVVSRAVVGVAAAIPALAGIAIHALPYGLAELVARSVAPQPQRIAFARIVAGAVLVAGAYAALTWEIAASMRTSPLQTVMIPVVAGALGMWALRWIAELRELGLRVRALRLRSTHPRLVERARGEASALLRLMGAASESAVPTVTGIAQGLRS
jgi:hypothetical protein